MNYIFLILFSVFCITGVFAENTPRPEVKQNAETFDLKVTITNIKSQKGILRLGLFNSSKTFLSKGKEYKTFEAKPDGSTLVFHIKGLEKGDYAASVYHDINSDDKCN